MLREQRFLHLRSGCLLQMRQTVLGLIVRTITIDVHPRRGIAASQYSLETGY